MSAIELGIVLKLPNTSICVDGGGGGRCNVDPEQTSAPSNAIYSPNVGLMLGQRRRRWPSINPALG